MIRKDHAAFLLEKALKNGADFAELFLEDREDVSIGYDNGPQELSTMRIFGAGIYLLAGTGSVYVCTSDLSLPSLTQALETAAALLALRTGGRHAAGSAARLRHPPPGTDSPLVHPKALSEMRAEMNAEGQILNPCPVRIYPGSIGHGRKIEILRQADSAASACSAALRRIRIDYFDRDQRVVICNSEGLDVEDRRVTTRLRFLPLVADTDSALSYFTDYSCAAGFECVADGQYRPVLEAALANMEENLRADEAVGGRFPVILERGGSPGTFFHEACGHQLETTELRRGGLFRDRLNTPVASEKVTLIDDGTLPGLYGSSRYDDEGTPRQRNLLIERGILKGFLTDRLGARMIGLDLTGSGRRQDYSFAPGARMSNTFLAPGDDDDEAIIADTPEGLYVTEIAGGTGGPEFTLFARSACWIRNGRVGRRVKGAMLSGRGDETMLRIDRVGRETVTEAGEGSFCGAESGFCATTGFGPRMRISEMLIGGRGRGKGGAA